MFVIRKDLEATILSVLDEEIPEKNLKEKIIIADAIIASLEGEFLDIVEDEDDDDFEDDEDTDEDEEYSN